jgi:K+-sensing histidine kinase KdpD
MSLVSRFVRQLSHDLRNHLNAAELQSAYVNELVEDAELKEEVKRLRGMLAEMSKSLQQLTNTLAPINLTLMPYEAAGFVQDLRQKVEMEFPEESRAIEWSVGTGAANLNIDPQILQPAFLELFSNAFRHDRKADSLCAEAKADKTAFTFTLTEPKSSFTEETENWGRQPFGKVKHGHYGLGLPRVRSIIEAHGGQFHARYDSPSSSLVTRIVLPIGSAE